MSATTVTISTDAQTRPPTDVRPFLRWVAALAMPIGPAAVAVIRFTIPGEPVGETVAANPGALRLVLWLGVVALLTLLPGAFAAVKLTRLRAPVLSLFVGALLIPGYLAMTALFGSDVVAMAGTDLGLDPALVTSLSEAVLAQPTTTVLLLMFVVGHILGTVLLGIAAYRARLTPRVVAVLLAVSQPLHLTAVIIGSPLLDLFAWGLTAIGMAFLGLRVARLSDDEWDVPSRPARPRRGDDAKS